MVSAILRTYASVDPDKCSLLRGPVDDRGGRHLRLARRSLLPRLLLETADRRRSRRLWGLGVEAHVHLMRGMTEMLLALDYADAGDPDARRTVTDVQLSLEMSATSLQQLLGELFDLQKHLLTEQPPPQSPD